MPATAAVPYSTSAEGRCAAPGAGEKEGSIILRVTTETSLCSEEKEEKKQSISGIPQKLPELLGGSGDETEEVVGGIFVFSEE